jgi:membrane protein DedA with SNARE-associated domain
VTLTAVLDVASGWPVPLVLVVATALLAIESGTLVGVLLPGTSILLALGLWSAVAGVAPWLVVLLAATGTVAGAHAGWWRGRRPSRSAVIGPRLRRRADAAARRLGDQGTVSTIAVLAAGHWASAARALLPRFAGRAGVPYRIAGPTLATSGTAWATTLVLLGNRVGPDIAGRAGWVVLAAVAGALATAAWRHRRRGCHIPRRRPVSMYVHCEEGNDHDPHLARPAPHPALPAR